MNEWDGFAPVAPTFSFKQRALDLSGGIRNRNGDEVRWWEGSTPDLRGITFKPQLCGGPSCAPIFCGCEDGCESCDMGRWPCELMPSAPVKFDPFWVYARAGCCDEVSTDPADTYDQLLNKLDVLGWSQIGRSFHLALQANSTDLTGAAPSTIVEGIGTLIRNRGILGLGGGMLVVPGYALPALEAAGVVSNNGGVLTGPANMPVISDPGFPVTGPGGAAPAPLSAYIYVIDQAPIAAYLSHTEGTGLPASYNHQDPLHRRLFTNACGCSAPWVRRQAITAFEPCGAFGIAVDVSGCLCAGPLPAPEIP